MKSRISWRRSLLATLLLIVLMIAASFVITGEINRMEEERSFERLHQEASSLAKEIETRKNSEQEQLASFVAGWEDWESPELWQLLDSFFPVGTMSRAEILLPDDTVIAPGGERVDVRGLLSFAEEAVKGAHISDRETDWQEDGGYVVRNFVPVIRDGETVAMLYGVVELGTLPEALAAEPYDGQAALYLIEGQTGDFLVDAWHNEPGGNIWALGERKMEPGYDHEQLKQGLIDGKEGYVVFLSETTGERLYFYYEPIAVNQWRIALSVPEDVVFASANGIRNILNGFLVVEAVCFLLYFLWMIRFVRRATSEKQRQLDNLNEIYDVEKLLFNAHEQQENMRLALEKIARMNRAEGAGFWALALPEAQGVFCWSAAGDPMAGPAAGRIRKALQDYFWQGQELFAAGSPEALVKAAEQKMYAAKRAYYQQEAHDRRRRDRSTGAGDASAAPGVEAAKQPTGAENPEPPAPLPAVENPEPLSYTEDGELLDVVDGNGFPTGRTVTRKEAHSRGIRHRTAHVWLVRRRGEQLEVLLQKRSAEKDAYPGCYDISSAGHVPAGAGYLDSAVRELREELGVEAAPRELHYCGRRWVYQEAWFHNAPFVDNQVSQVYFLWKDLEPEQLTLQREEVESVRWMELEQCRQWVREGRMKTCIATEELDLLAGALYGWKKRIL